ncbi:MAG: methyltransferase domain-containing protein [Planctomycetota bacterium]
MTNTSAAREVPDPRQVWSDLVLLLRLAAKWFALACRPRGRPWDEIFLLALYRVFLKREPDAPGLRHWLTRLRTGSLTPMGLLLAFRASPEFLRLTGRKTFLAVLHECRLLMVKSCLPPARTIVDLGGAAPDCPEGALLSMGYPHNPDELIIVDLPPQDRFGSWHDAEPQTHRTPGGTAVRYLYTSMSDLSPIPDASVDLVFAGQSIEHVSENDTDATLAEVRRILKPGGCFCLDTPNRALTRFHVPHGFVHPEHRKEYFVSELVGKVTDCGFDVIETKALCPIPKSLKTGRIYRGEAAKNIRLGDNPEEGYLFFLKCRKPGP